MLLLLALATLSTAVLGSVFLRGKERAWWIGFAFFGGVYLALVVGPWSSETFEPQLGARLLLD
jgi:drug/metabolite transporter (DMT)-like permease